MNQAPSLNLKEDEIYRQLQQHLDTLPVPFPPTDSGVEIRLLKRLFTLEEAKIASMLKFAWYPLETLAQISERLVGLGFTTSELEVKLDAMAKKGAIMARNDGGTKRYSNAQLLVGIFELQVDKMSEGFVDEMHQYFNEGFLKAANQVPLFQMRVVPVGVSVDLKAQIFTYDDIKKIIAAADGPFTLNNCMCRQVMDVKGHPCKNTKKRDLCISWGPHSMMYVSQGWGKPISRERVLEVLKENEKEGMILQASNAQKPDFVCSCCACCDTALSILSKLPTPASFVASNYVARSDPEACTGCGICIDRCQMTAITLKDEKSVVNAFRCIGCGNCVATCGSDAMHLLKKDFETLPPPTTVALYDTMLAERKKIKLREEKKRARQAAKS